MRRRCLGVVVEQLGRVLVDHLQLRHVAVDVILDSAQQMRFAQARFAVDEQRVQVRLAWRFSHCRCHGVGQAVRIADDEVLEREGGKRRGVV